jgi:hypothetical protein
VSVAVMTVAGVIFFLGRLVDASHLGGGALRFT